MGEVTTEACADYRQETCIESTIGEADDFSQAGCVVNRWQDCVLQGEQRTCENIDKRDCTWIAGPTEDGQFVENKEQGTCVPTISPGIQFWDESATSQCEIASQACEVVFEKGLFGGEKCIKNCHCLEEGWEEGANNICTAIGDCGSDYNFINKFVENGEGEGTNNHRPGNLGRASLSPSLPSVNKGILQGFVVKTYNKLN